METIVTTEPRSNLQQGKLSRLCVFASQKQLVNLLAENEKLLARNTKLEESNAELVSLIQFGTAELEQRNKIIDELKEELNQQKELSRELEKDNKLLKEELEKKIAIINLLNQMIYGTDSQKQESAEIFEEEESIYYKDKNVEFRVKKTRRGAQIGHKGHGRKIPENLPVKEEYIDLPEGMKKCQECGRPFEETRLVNISNRVSFKKLFYIIRYLQKIYKPTCPCGSKLVAQPLPPTLIPQSKFSTEFWTELLINKYFNHLPVQRQISDMKFYGLEVSSGTITEGFKVIHHRYIEPLYRALIEEIKKSTHVHGDESGWHIFNKIEGKKNYNWYMWLFVGFIPHKIAVFILDPTRSSKVLYKYLIGLDDEEIERIQKDKNYHTNTEPKIIVVSDKYSGYKALKADGFILIQFCWAHQRGEFEDLLTKYPKDEELKDWVEMWIKGIALLYKVNDERIKYKPQEPDFVKYHKRLLKTINWMEKEINKQYQHPAQKEIIRSMKEHRDGLTLFVNRPEVPMDNNLDERTFKPVMLGRNNYWGNHSIWAGAFTAAMFSIIQTCILNGIAPKAFFRWYFEKCTKNGSAPDESEISSFLPHKLIPEIKEKLKITQAEVCGLPPEILDDS